jgi:hypothetical protein
MGNFLPRHISPACLPSTAPGLPQTGWGDRDDQTLYNFVGFDRVEFGVE